jgi:hypothetical protein
MTKTLTLATGNFDQINTFSVEVQTRRGLTQLTCQLRRDYHKQGDGVYWALNRGGVLKDVYSDADRAETGRLASEQPVRNGDVVQIDGKLYTAKVLGVYSDACIFNPVQ